MVNLTRICEIFLFKVFFSPYINSNLINKPSTVSKKQTREGLFDQMEETSHDRNLAMLYPKD
jgi:hypothetical protein